MEATMDGNRSKPDFNFPKKKCGRSVNSRVDRVSELPDEIRIAILSFLPLTDAARTSILSRRWSDLWKHSPNLNFSDDTLKLGYNTLLEKCIMENRGSSWEAEKCRYVGLVNSILQSHKSPFLKQFTIGFYVNESAHSQVAKWLEFVFLRGVERLKLDFHGWDPEYHVVLEEVLRESGLCRPQNLILFKSLTSLCLNHMKVGGEAINLILLNFPLLEELFICFVSFTSGVEVRGDAHLMLKRLSIYGHGSVKSMKISAPNLTFLGIDTEQSVNLLLENVPKLAAADFRFVSGKPNGGRNLASVLLCLSSQLEILSLTLQYSEVFLAKGFPLMPNLKKLVVRTYSLVHVTALIWASPFLQELKLVFQGVRSAAFTDGRRNGERSPHHHLKVFELAGFLDGAGEQVKLVNYILDNCVTLKKIILVCGLSVLLHNPDSVSSQLIHEKLAAKDYARRRLQHTVPQHIQLQIL